MNSQTIYDLAVIGAGIYGIQAARIYLTIHPNDKVIIFEASGVVGGVWSNGESLVLTPYCIDPY
jgi:cation diffusion facilitator CzcD-associated flavoprotein CzcO